MLWGKIKNIINKLIRKRAGRIIKPPLEMWKEKAQPLAKKGKKFDQKELQAVIGFDLGTSCTKVCIRTPYEYGKRTLAVSFVDLAHCSCQYLLPTKIYISRSGIASLHHIENSSEHSDLKWRLMESICINDKKQIKNMVPTVAYLALALRYAKQWFLESEHDLCKGRLIRWHLNFGIPSTGYDDRSEHHIFESAAKAAWCLSLNNDRLQIHSVEEMISKSLKENFDAGIAINIIPEVAAEVVGYAKSPLRNNGLHVLVDVGASTLDICGFVLHEQRGDDQYALLTASVERLGVHSLHNHRLQALGSKLSLNKKISQSLIDPMAPIPESCRDYLAEKDHEIDPEKIDYEFEEFCISQLLKTLIDLKRNRDPHSPHFKDGLPLFMCGGGAQMNYYKKMVEKTSWRFTAMIDARSLKLEKLPIPSDLDNKDLDEKIFLRLAVAYGLSFDSFDIGAIKPPIDIESIPVPASRDYRSNFIDKDQV